MKVLVTGAAGLIGGDAVRALSSAGHHVFRVTRRQGADVRNLPGATCVDLRTPTAISSLVGHAPDLIVHTAGVLPVSFDGDQAAGAARENRAIDDVVLAAISAIACPSVYISTTSLYGCVQHRCSEESPVIPRGPYGEEKYTSECRFLELEYPCTILRVSAPYGSGQRSSTVLKKFVQQASRGEDLLYFGTGAREQDFTAVEDISAAIVAASITGKQGVFNIASGRPISMKELANLVISIVGSSTSRVYQAALDDPEEQCRASFDITKSERELSWRPMVALALGIQRLAGQREHASPDESDPPEQQTAGDK